MRPQEVGAETRLGDEFHADLFALGAQEKLAVVKHQKTLLGGALQKQPGFQTQLLRDFRRRQLALRVRRFCRPVVIGF